MLRQLRARRLWRCGAKSASELGFIAFLKYFHLAEFSALNVWVIAIRAISGPAHPYPPFSLVSVSKIQFVWCVSSLRKPNAINGLFDETNCNIDGGYCITAREFLRLILYTVFIGYAESYPDGIA